MTNHRKLSGACLCGTVQYSILSAITQAVHCHCSICRKAHAAAFGSYCRVPAHGFELATGLDKLKAHRSSHEVERYFCQQCGTHLFYINHVRYPTWVSIALATIDSRLEELQQQHAYTWSKAGWYHIRDHYRKHRFEVPAKPSRGADPANVT